MSLIRHFKCNDSASDTVIVDAISGNNGTSSVNTDTRCVDGKINNAVLFSGSNYISANIPELYDNTGSFSLAYWFKTDQDSYSHPIITKYDGALGTDGSYYMATRVSTSADYSRIDASFKDTAGTWQDVCSNFAYTPLNYWHHYTLVKDGSTSAFYINGNPQSTATVPESLFSSSTNTVIGLIGGILPAGGPVDDVRFYNHALTSTEVSEIYNGGYGTEDTAIGIDAQQNCVYVNDNGTWRLFQQYTSFRVKKRQNQPSEFELQIYDIKEEERDYVKEQAEVLFFAGETMILKGRIQSITYGTSYEITARGVGMEAKLLDAEFVKDGERRVEYTNEEANTVALELLSENADGSSPWILTPNTGASYGNITMRYEYANRLNCLGALASAVDYEWNVSQSSGDDYAENTFNFLPAIGNYASTNKRYRLTSFDPWVYDTSGDDIIDSGEVLVMMSDYLLGLINYINLQEGLVLWTYGVDRTDYESINASAVRSSMEKDISNMANVVSFLGYGDGENQLSTTTYAASTQSSSLANDITDTDTTIPTLLGSAFDATGTVRIAEELVTYAGIDGDNLTGATRGVGSTAYPHKKDVYIEQYFPLTSSQSGSSIYTYGQIASTQVDTTVLDRETAELIASGFLIDHLNPIERIKIVPDEPLTDAGTLGIGDLVTLLDDEAGIYGNYRIVGIEYIDNYGALGMEIELSNVSLEFIQQMQQERQNEQNLQRYMQGATNIYALTESENCDESFPLNMRFFLPDEAVAINRVTLNFRTQKFRAYNQTSEVNSASSTVAASGSKNQSVSLTSNSWTNGASITTANSDCEGVFLNADMEVYDVTGSDSGNGQFLYRIYDGSAYYPDSTGGTIAGGYIFTTPPPSMAGAVSQYMPGNNKNKTYTLQLKWAGYSNDTDWSLNTGIEYRTMSRHTHDMDYGVYEETFPAGSPKVAITVNGTPVSGSPVGVANNGTYEVDITDEVKDVGVGNWVTIAFTPQDGSDHNKLRVEANAYVQIFIEST